MRRLFWHLYAEFLGETRLGRKVLPVLHRRAHRERSEQPWVFGGQTPCWVCGLMLWNSFEFHMSEAALDAFNDESRIELMAPDEEAGHKGIVITATVQRQLDALDEPTRAKLMEHFREIAANSIIGESLGDED